MEEEEDEGRNHSGWLSASLAHSLPNVGTEFSMMSSLSELENFDARVVSVTDLDNAGIPCLGQRMQSDNSVDMVCQSLSSAGEHLTAPVLHRALSTSPRLEHTTEGKLLQDDNHRQMIDCEDDRFFPWSNSNEEFDLSASLPAVQLHERLRFSSSLIKESENVTDSDTVLSKENGTFVEGSKKLLVGRVRSRIRGLARASSQRNSLTSSISDSQRRLFRVFFRQDSQASATSLASRCNGSSIFGSKLFESMSSVSTISQHVHIVAESAGVYPSLGSHCSVDCGSLSRPTAVSESGNGYFDSEKSFFPIRTHGHVSSASCINDDQSYGIISDETVSLHRSVSLPSRYHYHGIPPSPVMFKATAIDIKNASEKSQDEEATDNVSELNSSAPALVIAASKRKWQQTMPDLVEGPESDTLTTMGSNRVKLAAAALAIMRGEYDDPELKGAEQSTQAKDEETLDLYNEHRRYMKNLMVLCVSFFFVFAAFLAIRNLQSSLNAEAGLGLYSLSAVYAFLFVGSMFTTTIVQRLGPKRAMAISMVGFVFYAVVNFYPRFYTLVPISAMLGFCMAVVWTSHSTYVTNIGVGYAKITDSKVSDVLSRFHGIFFAFFQAAQIAGGLISSLLLTTSSLDPSSVSSGGLSVTGNKSASLEDGLLGNWSFTTNYASSVDAVETKSCGSLYCPHKDFTSHHARADADPNKILILMVIFLLSTITGLVILVFLLDPLEGIMKKTHASFQHQMTAVFRFFYDRRVICMLGLPFYSLLQSSFMFGEFTKSFVTCSLGVHMVGFLMLTLSLSSGISAYIAGYMKKYVGRMVLILSALLMHFVLLFVMYFWTTNKEQLPVFFIIVAVWGLSDGFLIPQIICLIGTLFVSNKEPAFSAHKMTQALSAFSMFASAPYLCTKVKIILVGSVIVIAAIGYTALEIILKIERRCELAKEADIIVEKKADECICEPVCEKKSEK